MPGLLGSSSTETAAKKAAEMSLRVGGQDRGSRGSRDKEPWKLRRKARTRVSGARPALLQYPLHVLFILPWGFGKSGNALISTMLRGQRVCLELCGYDS